LDALHLDGFDQPVRIGDYLGGRIMHLYWRIKEELLYLGEVLVFLDPRFIREYRRWVERNLRGRGANFTN